MIPTSFDYVRAGSVKEALNLLSAGDGSKVIAGGHSLLPMMRFRLVQAPKLIDISRLDELKGVQEFKKGVRIGAATPYADLVGNARAVANVLRRHVSAGEIADIQVRNRGTVGGNLCVNDPTNHLPPLFVALGATMTIRGNCSGG